MAPIVLWAWWRRRYAHGLVVGIVSVAAAGSLFAVNAMTTGELNYQGGDRRTFYSKFPFDASRENVWAAAEQHSTRTAAE